MAVSKFLTDLVPSPDNPSEEIPRTKLHFPDYDYELQEAGPGIPLNRVSVAYEGLSADMFRAIDTLENTSHRTGG